MPRVRIGARTVETRFAVPSGTARDVLRALDDAALGYARARVARALGDPDPFPVRAAMAAAPEAVVEGGPGEALTPDAADAALLRAGRVPEMAGLFAGRPPGPRARAVPVDDPAATWLRWPREPPPPPRVGELETWSTSAIGDADVATVRCAIAVPGGVALGSDYGLTLARGGGFAPFPWPGGARREARRVEAMAVHEGALHVATSQTLYRWDFRGEPTGRKHPPDADGGWDDPLSMLPTGDGRLLVGWRTRFEGGDGPPDTLALAETPGGVVYAGTRDGEVHVVDGGGPVRAFADGDRRRPVRHLAWAAGALWVAAAGELHRFDGAAWTAAGPEPTALAVDPRGRLWALAEGALHVLDGGELRRVDVPLERPWCLAAVPGALWIGGRERVWRLRVG